MEFRALSNQSESFKESFLALTGVVFDQAINEILQQYLEKKNLKDNQEKIIEETSRQNQNVHKSCEKKMPDCFITSVKKPKLNKRQKKRLKTEYAPNVDKAVSTVNVPNPRYQCKECSEQFTTLTKLVAHLNTHSNQHIYVCVMCGQDFASQNNLMDHSLRCLK